MHDNVNQGFKWGFLEKNYPNLQSFNYIRNKSIHTTMGGPPEFLKLFMENKDS